MVNSNLVLDELKNISCTPLTMGEETYPSISFTFNNDGGIKMETIKHTDRQVEINKELKELQEKETALNAEYEAEAIKAKAEHKAQKRYIKYKAYIDAGFNETQAFAMLGEED